MDFSEIPTCDLVKYLSFDIEDQEFINQCALELTKRTWIPELGVSFDELLFKYGYKDIKGKSL